MMQATGPMVSPRPSGSRKPPSQATTARWAGSVSITLNKNLTRTLVPSSSRKSVSFAVWRNGSGSSSGCTATRTMASPDRSSVRTGRCWSTTCAARTANSTYVCRAACSTCSAHWATARLRTSWCRPMASPAKTRTIRPGRVTHPDASRRWIPVNCWRDDPSRWRKRVSPIPRSCASYASGSWRRRPRD